MVKFGSVSYWIGEHPKLGPLVFPKKDSFEGFRETTVKLFIVNQSRIAEFDTAVAKESLSGNIGDLEAMNAAHAYIAYLHAEQHGFGKTGRLSINGTFTETKRGTHCFQCRTYLNSKVNFACGACGWIVCPSCGSCGCNCNAPSK